MKLAIIKHMQLFCYSAKILMERSRDLSVIVSHITCKENYNDQYLCNQFLSAKNEDGVVFERDEVSSSVRRGIYFPHIALLGLCDC